MRWTNTKRAIPFILCWSLGVHLPGLFSPLRDYHAYRQCQTASMARNYVRHGMHFLSPEVDTEGPPVRAGTEFPIYSYILALLFRGFGVHEILGRLLSSLFAAWGAVYLYLFVRRRLGNRIALWSALVMCSIPVHIYFTRTVQPEPMALWGFLGFLYYADLWLYRHGGREAWLLALLLGALAPLLKLPFLYVVFPLWAYLGYECYGVKAFTHKRWLSLMGLILILTETWYHYAKTAAVVLLPLGVKDHLANLAPILTRRLWEAQFVSRIPELVCTYSGLLFIGVGVYYYRKAKSFKFFLVWSVTCGVYVVLLGEYGLIHRYTLLPLAPLSAVWIACGITAFWEHAKSIRFGRLLAIVLIVGIPVHAAFRIKHWYRVEYGYTTPARQTLASISRPDELVLVVSHEKPELLYYLDRYGYAIDPTDWREAEVDRLIRQGVRYLFIPRDDNRQRLVEWKSTLAHKGQLVSETPDYLLYRIDGSTVRLRQG